MLFVRTYVAPSAIHGLGLFAKESIPKGTKIWEFVPGIDVKIPKDKMLGLPAVLREYLEFYTYQNKVTQDFVLCSDSDRFINHSNTPNTENVNFGSEEGITVALKNINADEELTTNYRQFDAREFDYL